MYRVFSGSLSYLILKYLFEVAVIIPFYRWGNREGVNCPRPYNWLSWQSQDCNLQCLTSKSSALSVWSLENEEDLGQECHRGGLGEGRHIPGKGISMSRGLGIERCSVFGGTPWWGLRNDLGEEAKRWRGQVMTHRDAWLRCCDLITAGYRVPWCWVDKTG